MNTQVQRLLAAPLLSKRAVPTLQKAIVSNAVRCSSNMKQEKQGVPKEDYYDGHLLVDHLEYIDDWLDHTVKIENTVKGLKETYAKKYDAYKTASPGATAELDALFHKAAAEKEELMQQLGDLKNMMLKAQNNTYYAVDAPDGMADAELADDQTQVDQIIDFASEHEDTEAIERRHFFDEQVKKDRARDAEHDW